MTQTMRVCLSLCLLVAAGSVLAQSARQAGNTQQMAQMQQLAAERTQLMTENTRLKQELEAAKKERDELKKKQGGTDTKVRSSEIAAARAEKATTALQGELDREKARMTEIVAKFRETVGQMRDIESERTTLKTSLTQRDTEFGECVKRNQSLYDLNGEILAKFDVNQREAMRSPVEGFTHLKRIQLENLIDGYQQRAVEQKPPAGAGN